MKNTNMVVLVGNLTRDPELKYTQGGVPICNMAIANNDSYKGRDGQYQDKVSYFDITVFNAQGENCHKYLKKGSKVCVTGRLVQDRWTNQEGQNRSKVGVTADRVEFLSSANGGENNEGGAQDPWAGQAAGGYDENGIPF